MPYKIEKVKIQGTMLDRRRKLTDEQKEEILRIYKTGTVGMRPLAKQFGVSRSLIQCIVNPQINEYRKQRVKDHWQDYFDKEKHNIAIKQTRQYKQNLKKEGKI